MLAVIAMQEDVAFFCCLEPRPLLAIDSLPKQTEKQVVSANSVLRHLVNVNGRTIKQ